MGFLWQVSKSLDGLEVMYGRPLMVLLFSILVDHFRRMVKMQEEMKVWAFFSMVERLLLGSRVVKCGRQLVRG